MKTVTVHGNRLELSICSEQGELPPRSARDYSFVDSIGDSGKDYLGLSMRNSADVHALVEVRYESHRVFGPQLLFVEETGTLFLGAGQTVAAYRITPEFGRVMALGVEPGVLSWERSGQVVLMAAELELAGFDLSGGLRWRLPVEPPWSYLISGGRLRVTIMGRQRAIDLTSGEAV